MPYLLFCLIALFSFACNAPANPSTEEPVSNESQAVQLDFAQNFEVKKQGDLTFIKILSPWKNAGKSVEYILYPREQEAPSNYPDANLIPVPVEKIICTSTIDIAFLAALGATDKIVAISNGDYVYNPAVQQALKDNTIIEIGGNNAIDYERALATEADLALVYNIGAQQSYKKFEELGISTVLLSDFMETSPLGRAEWLKFVAYLLGKEQEANQQFEQIKKAYLATKTLAKQYSQRPKVLTGAVYKGTWYIAGGKSLMAQLIQDAGGAYLWEDNQEVSGVPLDFEAVYPMAMKADRWINMSSFQDKKSLLEANENYKDFKAVKEGYIYNSYKRVTPNGGSDAFESAIVQPHLVLNDFMQIFHATTVHADSLYYYIPLQ